MRYVEPEMAALPELLESRADGARTLEEEVTALFDEYRGPLFRFLLSVGLETADVEETIQEVFLALFQHLRAGKRRDNLRAWLFQVGHNMALKLRRRRPPMALEPVVVHTPEMQAMENQARRRVAAMIEALPEQDRACLALRAEGLRYREIAEVMGISLGGVALSLERSIARLSKGSRR